MGTDLRVRVSARYRRGPVFTALCRTRIARLALGPVDDGWLSEANGWETEGQGSVIVDRRVRR